VQQVVGKDFGIKPVVINSSSNNSSTQGRWSGSCLRHFCIKDLADWDSVLGME